MKRGFAVWMVFIVVLCAFTQAQQSSTASVPRLVRFTGAVTNASGAPRTGVVGVMFSLYTEQQGGTALWTELQNVTLDANGQYTVLLGSQHSDGVPAELFTTNEARWLGIQVEAEPEQPRVLLVSVPYALKAGDAETLGGKPLSAFLLNPSADNGGATGAATGAATTNASTTSSGTNTATIVPSSVNTSTSGGTANFVAKWIDASTIGNSQIFDTGTGVGIGTSSPESFFAVEPPTTAGYIKFNNQPWGLRLGSLQAGQQFLGIGVGKSGADNNYIAKTLNVAAVSHAIMEMHYDGSIRFKQQAHQPDGTVLNLTDTLAITPGQNVGIGVSNPESILDIERTTAQYVKLNNQPWGFRIGALQDGRQFIGVGVKKTAADNNYIATSLNNAAVAHSIFEMHYDGSFHFKQQAHQPDGTILTPNETLTIGSNGFVGIGTSAPSQRLSVTGVVESTSGGFKFPDGTLLSSTSQLPQLGSANTFTNTQTINGDLTLTGSITIGTGNKKMILGGLATPSGGVVASGAAGSAAPSSPFGFNVLDDLGNQVVTVDTSGTYGSAILKAVQSKSAAGCGSNCYFVNSPAAIRGDATSTTAGEAAFGIIGTSNSIGVFGSSEAAYGVYGYSGATTFSSAAVSGYIKSTTGNAYGVWGATASTGNGATAGGFQALGTAGQNIGVYATTASPDGTAGSFASTATGTGTNGTWAVYATTQSPNATAGDFRNFATTGSMNAVYGETNSVNGTGATFASNSGSGLNYGMYALNKSTGGVGGLFNASATTGGSFALWSRAHSTTGIAGVFDVPLAAGNGYILNGRQCDFNGTGNCTALFRVFGDGTTWVGTAGTPGVAALFQVFGQSAIGTPTSNADLYVYGTLRYNGAVQMSSRRFKKNIHTIENALDKVERLRGVSYDLRQNGSHQIGVIAEEVGEVVPEVVAFEANGKDAQGVDYSRLTALLIEAVKEQQTKINALEAELKGLKAKVENGDQKPTLANLK